MPKELPFSDEPDRGPFWAYVRVTSSQLKPPQITEALGVEPDESHSIGDPNPSRECTIYGGPSGNGICCGMMRSRWEKHANRPSKRTRYHSERCSLRRLTP